MKRRGVPNETSAQSGAVIFYANEEQRERQR
jgi:hypothetical protein